MLKSKVLLIVAIGVPLVMRMTTSKVILPPPPNIGFFHFDQYQKLHPEYLKNAQVRMALDWQSFEPKPGKFIFDATNKQARQIDEYVKKGYTVIPSIRSKSNWAVEPAMEVQGQNTRKKEKIVGGIAADCGSAPLDMDTKKPLRDGESYSETYYRFVKTIAERYRSKFPIVVIENEINDPFPEGGDWCSSVDKYFRLLLTAKKAFRDVDPAVRIADGAIQPRALMWLTIEEYLKNGKTAEAIRIYSRMEGKNISYEQLLTEKTAAFSEPRISRAKEFIANGLYQWVDIGNFHYVHDLDALPEIVSFLRKSAPAKKPFMTDAFGGTKKHANDEKESAKEIIYRTTRLLALQVSPVVLMTVPGNDRVVTALVDIQGNSKPLNIHAFEAVARFLGKVLPSSVKDMSNDKRWSYQFQAPSETVEVLWPKNKDPLTFPVENLCDVFDYQNTQLKNTRTISPDAAPIFVVCRRASQKSLPKR